MRGKVPSSFPLFWREWMSSPSIMSMTLAQQGAYLRLLIVQWEYGIVEDRMVAAVLGLEPEVAEAMLNGPLGMEFPYNEEGERVNVKLDALRVKALGKSAAAQRAAITRWSTEPVKVAEDAKEKPETKRRKARRLNSEREFEGAVALYDATNPAPLPSSLRDACDEYRKLRSERGFPVWRKEQWLKNLNSDFDHAEWEMGYREATRNEWRSVHPKKGTTSFKPKFKPSKFGDDAPPLDPLPEDPIQIPQDNFIDPNLLWDGPDDEG